VSLLYAGLVAQMGHMFNVYRAVVKVPEGKIPFGRPYRSWNRHDRDTSQRNWKQVVDWIESCAQDSGPARCIKDGGYRMQLSDRQLLKEGFAQCS
jgi:hypothetical protein